MALEVKNEVFCLLMAFVLCLFSRLLLTKLLSDLFLLEDGSSVLVADDVGFKVSVGSIIGGL